MIAPIFFQQKTVTCSIHNANFEELLGEISPTHLCWAQLMKEQVTQEENDGGNLDQIVRRLAKSSTKPNIANMVAATFGWDCPIKSTFLANFKLLPTKWACYVISLLVISLLAIQALLAQTNDPLSI